MNPSNYTKAEEAPPPQQPPVVGVPFHQHHQQRPAGSQQEGPWSTGLCNCFEDVPNCCITCWCPCITFGRVSEIVDKGATSCAVNGAIYGMLTCFTGCGCLFSWLYRSKMRKSFGLQQSPCNDCCVHWCCDECALCQEYRELQNRGFDMTIGWEGNMQRQNNRGVAMAPSAPVLEGGMTR